MMKIITRRHWTDANIWPAMKHIMQTTDYLKLTKMHDSTLLPFDTSGEKAVVPVKVYHDIPMIEQLYAYVVSQKELGISIWECRQVFRTPRLEARAWCRTMERVGVVKDFMWDKYKQREQRYRLLSPHFIPPCPSDTSMPQCLCPPGLLPSSSLRRVPFIRVLPMTVTLSRCKKTAMQIAVFSVSDLSFSFPLQRLLCSCDLFQPSPL